MLVLATKIGICASMHETHLAEGNDPNRAVKTVPHRHEPRTAEKHNNKSFYMQNTHRSLIKVCTQTEPIKMVIDSFS